MGGPTLAQLGRGKGVYHEARQNITNHRKLLNESRNLAQDFGAGTQARPWPPDLELDLGLNLTCSVDQAVFLESQIHL